MTVTSKPPVEYYYDTHLTEEDRLSYNELQSRLVPYLVAVLQWLFHIERWHIAMDLAIYITDNSDEEPTAPDVAVYKGVVLEENREDYLTSWHVDPPDSPPPSVVIEVASRKTWRKDLDEKPAIYARMGVSEYVYYDPRPGRPRRSPQLKVWRNVEGTAIEAPADEQGRVWSQELESWLVPDGCWLRLYDRSGQLRLTDTEAERSMKEAERQRAEAERKLKEAERRRANAESQRAEAERQRAEAERELKERAWEALRKLGVDPETLK